MNHTEINQQEIKLELTKLRAEMDKLKAQAAKEKAEQRVKFDAYLETLDEKSDEVGAKLEELKDTSGEAVEDIKTGLKEAWQRLAIAKQAAKARFH